MSNEQLREQALAVLTEISELAPKGKPEYKHRQERERGHAEDVVNWIYKLSQNPSPELLMAGWLHDCERLQDFEATAGFKGDRDSQAYLEHKRSHAKRSAGLAQRFLTALGIPEASISRTCELILHHDDTGAEIEQRNDEDLKILAAADSFPFFHILRRICLKEKEQKGCRIKQTLW